MRAERLLSILFLLQARTRMTAAEIAERLEVSVRTIYRDLDALSIAGVPVFADRGPGGGCALRRGYRTDLSGLTPIEAASLFAGTAGRQLRDLGLGAGFQSALAKLEVALPSDRREQAVQVRERIHVDATPWFAPRESTRHLPVLRDAVLDERVVGISYRRANGREVVRRTRPLGLVVKGGIWYFVGVTAGETRVYRVSRLRLVSATKEKFDRPRGFNLAAFWDRWSMELEARIPQYSIKMRVTAEGRSVLPQVLGERVRIAIDAAPKLRGGGLLLDYTFDSIEAACGSVLSLGSLVEVIEPVELRAAVRTAAAAIVRRYSE